jgi:hypothetical protein
MNRETPLYDWAQDLDATPRADLLPAVRPMAAPAVVPPIPTVVQYPGQLPYYAHLPAQPVPAYDPLPQRMMGCGIMAFGIGVGAGVAGLGCGYGADLMFTGMSHATAALIGLAGAFVAGAVMLLVLRSVSGVRIGHFHQGDNSSFHVGR